VKARQFDVRPHDLGIGFCAIPQWTAESGMRKKERSLYVLFIEI